MDTRRQPRSNGRAHPRFTVREDGGGRLALHLQPCPAGVITDGLEDVGVATVRIGGRDLPAAVVGGLGRDLEFTAASGAGPVEVAVRGRHAVVRAPRAALEAVLRRWLEAALRAQGLARGLDGLTHGALAGLTTPLPVTAWREPRVARSHTPRGVAVEFRTVTPSGVPLGDARRWIAADDAGERSGQAC